MPFKFSGHNIDAGLTPIYAVRGGAGAEGFRSVAITNVEDNQPSPQSISMPSFVAGDLLVMWSHGASSAGSALVNAAGFTSRGTLTNHQFWTKIAVGGEAPTFAGTPVNDPQKWVVCSFNVGGRTTVTFNSVQSNNCGGLVLPWTAKNMAAAAFVGAQDRRIFIAIGSIRRVSATADPFIPAANPVGAVGTLMFNDKFNGANGQVHQVCIQTYTDDDTLQQNNGTEAGPPNFPPNYGNCGRGLRIDLAP